MFSLTPIIASLSDLWTWLCVRAFVCMSVFVWLQLDDADLRAGLLDQKAVRVLIVGRSSLHLRSSLMIKLQLWFQGRKQASKEEAECV